MRSRTIVLVMLLLSTEVFLGSLPSLRDTPIDAVGWYTLGRTLTNEGNYTEALQAYNQSLALDPGYAASWDGIADVLNRANRYTADPACHP